MVLLDGRRDPGALVVVPNALLTNKFDIVGYSGFKPFFIVSGNRPFDTAHSRKQEGLEGRVMELGG